MKNVENGLLGQPLKTFIFLITHQPNTSRRVAYIFCQKSRDVSVFRKKENYLNIFFFYITSSKISMVLGTSSLIRMRRQSNRVHNTVICTSVYIVVVPKQFIYNAERIMFCCWSIILSFFEFRHYVQRFAYTVRHHVLLFLVSIWAYYYYVSIVRHDTCPSTRTVVIKVCDRSDRI